MEVILFIGIGIYVYLGADLYSDKEEKAWDDLIKEADLNGDGEVKIHLSIDLIYLRLIITNSWQWWQSSARNKYFLAL